MKNLIYRFSIHLALVGTLGLASVTVAPRAEGAPVQGQEPRGQGVQAPPAICCAITAIDSAKHLVTAKETANGHTFQFTVPDQRLLGTLRVGHPVYANFQTKQVSLDGKTISGTIVSVSTAGGRPAGLASPPASQLALKPYTLPTVTFGTPHPKSRETLGVRSAVNANMIHLRGEDGIKQAQGLPEGARNLLIMHVRTLPPGESVHYIVNKQLAEEWMNAHPAPADAKPSEKKQKGKCDMTHTEGCVGAVQDYYDEKVVKQWRDEWTHVTKEYAHDLHMVEDCLADQPLRPASDIPVQFSVPLEFPLSFEKDGKKDNSHGSASGTVKGTVTIGVPVDANFKASLELSYIPCLPFAIRPKSLSANGDMTVSARLGASLNATGQFSEFFTIPPTGGPKIPIEVIPIVIAGVPVAELDVSVYIDGTVEVGGEGNLSGHFKLNAPYKTAFDFKCDGKICGLNSHNVPVPTTTSEDVELKGKVHVKPAIYAALQLDIDWELLSARVGPQPYLWGELWGCGAASATQSTGGQATAQEQYALTADLDWAIELRAEALVADKIVAKRLVKLMDRKHIWFGDLAPPGSNNAMTAGVTGVTQVAAGQSAAYKLKMRQCYPYADDVQYQVTWTGGATATGSTGAAQPSRNTKGPTSQINAMASMQPVSGSGNSSCVWQTGQGTCWADPRKDTVINLVWPSAGQYGLTVVPVSDKHPRKFNEQATQMNISVQ